MLLKEIYTTVRKHLLEQGEPAIEFGEGVYYSDDGLKCAVGCLIKPEAYSPALEHKSCGSRLVINALGRSGIADDPLTVEMLLDLQEIHDSYSVENWEGELNRIKIKYFGG